MKKSEIEQDDDNMGFQVIRGKVKSVKAISRRTAYIEMAGFTGLFILSVSQYWSVRRNDDISMVFSGRYSTGEYPAYAYKNHTQDIMGWNDINPEHSISKFGIILLCLGLGLSVSLGVFGFAAIGAPLMITGIYVFYFNYKSTEKSFDDKAFYDYARELIEME